MGRAEADDQPSQPVSYEEKLTQFSTYLEGDDLDPSVVALGLRRLFASYSEKPETEQNPAYLFTHLGLLAQLSLERLRQVGHQESSLAPIISLKNGFGSMLQSLFPGDAQQAEPDPSPMPPIQEMSQPKGGDKSPKRKTPPTEPKKPRGRPRKNPQTPPSEPEQ
ncbi:hypothetical protein C4579_04245 [Candidatus Microgenomates bacterium]|nr:MAG: hypothetical protein C4579_04245 [Candidatus Microgenomates bacterium]